MRPEVERPNGFHAPLARRQNVVDLSFKLKTRASDGNLNVVADTDHRIRMRRHGAAVGVGEWPACRRDGYRLG